MDGALNQSGERFQRCGFKKRVHWFRVDERLIRVKKSAVYKIARFVSTWTNYV